jgi:hypothetical protein
MTALREVPVQLPGHKMLAAWHRFRVPLTCRAGFHGLMRDEHLLGYNSRAGEVLSASNSEIVVFRYFYNRKKS